MSLKLEKGKVYKQIMNADENIDEDINGMAFNMKMNISGTISFLVKDINENGFIMDAQYETLSMSIQTPQGNMDYSSEKKDETDIFSQILAALKYKTFEINMSKSGRIIEIKNIESLWGKLIDQFSQLNEAQKEQVKAKLLESYGNDAIKGNFEMTTAIYPEMAVSKGDKWNITTPLKGNLSVDIHTEYTFADLTKNYALIKGYSILETADTSAYTEINGMEVKYKLKGSMLSDIKVDNQSGWIIEARIHQDVKGDAFMKANAQFPEGMKIPITFQNEMTVTGNQKF